MCRLLVFQGLTRALAQAGASTARAGVTNSVTTQPKFPRPEYIPCLPFLSVLAQRNRTLEPAPGRPNVRNPFRVGEFSQSQQTFVGQEHIGDVAGLSKQMQPGNSPGRLLWGSPRPPRGAGTCRNYRLLKEPDNGVL